MNQSGEKKTKEKFILLYDPSKWSSLKRFGIFVKGEYSITSQTRSLLRSIELRFDKIQLLWTHFNKIKNVQPKEYETLNIEGYVNPVCSKLMAAIFEAVLNEFYSINDNVVKILGNIYPQRNLPKTMSKLISGIGKSKYELPEPIANTILNHKSYQRLRNIRTETSHFSSGSIVCGKTISYMSEKSGPTITFNHNALLIEDVERYFIDQYRETILFVNNIFDYLESTLRNNQRVRQICGVYKKLLYQRLEGYMDWKTQRQGICKPIWEENRAADECPLAKNCKAYNNYLLHKV